MGNHSLIHCRRAFILLGVLTLALVGSHDLLADDEEGSEWKTMHSERVYRPRSSHSASSSSTPSSIKLDEQKQKITTPKISFGSNGVDPTSSSQGALKQLANFLNKKPEIAVRIEGHSDSVGSDQSNLDISQKRADRAKEILVTAGVAAERLEAVGMGDKYPVASDTTSDGQEKNRRIEFSVMGSMAPSVAPVAAPIAAQAEPVAPAMPMPVAPVPPTPIAPSYPSAPSYPAASAYPTAPSYPAASAYPTTPAYPPQTPSPYPIPQPAPSPVSPTPMAPSYPAASAYPTAPSYPAPVSPAPSTVPPVPTPVR